MDPVSIVSIVNAALGLALKCGKVATDLNALITTFRQSELSIHEIINDCRMIETVLKRIEPMTHESTLDEDVLRQLNSSLHLGAMVISALEEDLKSVLDTGSDSGFRRRTKIMWNDALIKLHQERVTRQLTALSCLLQVMELPSLSEQRETLTNKVEIFRKAESTARTIIASGDSMSTIDLESVVSTESAELEYRRLSFEDQLFTASVYKRSFRTRGMAKFFKRKRNRRADTKESASQGILADVDRPHQRRISESTKSSTDFDVITEYSHLKKTVQKLGETYNKAANGWTNPMMRARAALQHEIALKLIRGVISSQIIYRALVSFGNDALFDLLDDWAALQSSGVQTSVDINSTVIADPGETISAWKQDCLIWACREGNLEVADALLTRNSDVNRGGLVEMTELPVDIAIRRGDGALLQLMLNKGACLPEPFPEGAPNLLLLAATKNQASLVPVLIENDSHERIKVKLSQKLLGYDALHWACKNRCLRVVRSLVQAGASVTSAADSNSFHPLHCLIYGFKNTEEAEDIAEYLVEHEADINATTSSNCTPLLLACDLGATAIAKQLLSLGASSDDGPFWHRRPLISALQHSPEDVDLIKTLLERGADPLSRDPETSCTSLHELARAYQATWKSTKVVRTLVASGVNLRTLDKHGRSAFHYAIMNPHARLLVERLVAEGVDPNEASEEGIHALHFATRRRLVHIETLLDLGADPNARDGKGRTPLHILVHNWGQNQYDGLEESTLQHFLDHGADINTFDSDGQSLLCLAILRVSPAAVNCLVNHGAHVCRRWKFAICGCPQVGNETTINRAQSRIIANSLEEVLFPNGEPATTVRQSALNMPGMDHLNRHVLFPETNISIFSADRNPDEDEPYTPVEGVRISQPAFRSVNIYHPDDIHLDRAPPSYAPRSIAHDVGDSMESDGSLTPTALTVTTTTLDISLQDDDGNTIQTTLTGPTSTLVCS